MVGIDDARSQVSGHASWPGGDARRKRAGNSPPSSACVGRLPGPPRVRCGSATTPPCSGPVGGPRSCSPPTWRSPASTPTSSVIGLDDLGWRAMAGAVSDVAAMGGRPDGAVVAVAGPPDTDLDLLYDGIAAPSEAHRCPVVGGDLSNAGEVVVAVTVTGHVEGEPGPVLRSGARPGDRLFVTGPLGAAAAGLRSLRARPGPARPEAGIRRSVPRARRQRWWRRTAGPGRAWPRGRRRGWRVPTAMVDVSDGLLADLGHLADASGVGFRLDAGPRGAGRHDRRGPRAAGRTTSSWWPPGTATGLEAAFAGAGLGRPILIGVCGADPSERTLAGEPVTAAGWEHSWR